MMPNLDIVPGKPAHQAAIDATQAWAELEEQKEIAETFLLDAREVMLERLNNTFDEVMVDNPSDDGEQSDMDIDDGDKSAQHVHGWKDMLLPPA